ncbi:MAG: hypothetical protein DRI57_33155 [Deltaproteobacteria bacterium]|nr:MAG: hypothetical protein DRI57_33155 [Deltaproteobacteria bacterium]
MYARAVWNDKRGNVQDLTCPEFLRLSEGARYIDHKIAWKENQKFFFVFDLDTGNEHYGTTTETITLCSVRHNDFRKKMKSKSARSKPIRNRFLVNRVPKVLFVERTGRAQDVQRNYFYRY